MSHLLTPTHTPKKLSFPCTTHIKPTKRSDPSISPHTQPNLPTGNQRKAAPIHIHPKKATLTKKKSHPHATTHTHKAVCSHIKNEFCTSNRCTFWCRKLAQSTRIMIIKSEKISQKNEKQWLKTIKYRGWTLKDRPKNFSVDQLWKQ